MRTPYKEHVKNLVVDHSLSDMVAEEHVTSQYGETVVIIDKSDYIEGNAYDEKIMVSEVNRFLPTYLVVGV